jgi:hypothetical protein
MTPVLLVPHPSQLAALSVLVDVAAYEARQNNCIVFKYGECMCSRCQIAGLRVPFYNKATIRWIKVPNKK